MEQVNLEELAAGLSGELAAPGDPGYEAGRKVWNVRFDRRPPAVARCDSAEDVKAAIEFARAHDLLLSVKGGGHAYAANTVADTGLLVDLSPMKEIVVDPDSKTARVAPGVTWGELDQATQEYGLATTGGTASTIGVSGFTLGGGTGYLVRKRGMAIDNLLSAEVVTAGGEIVRASMSENADLFWALRGGGGNFGVATSFEFQLYDLGPQVLAGQIVHLFEDAPDLLRLYRDFMAQAPEEIQCYGFILRVPPIEAFPEQYHGRLAFDFVVFHADPDGLADFAPLMEAGQPILKAVAPQPYTAVQQSFDAGLPAGQRYESRSHYLPELSDAAIETITAHARGLVGPFSVAYLEPLGGAVGRVDPGATAFPHRDAAFSFHILAGWMDAGQDGEVMDWAKSFHQAMAPYGTGGVYVNLLGTGEEGRVQAAYGDNYDRLVALKKKWDPDNLFRMNHNIPPSE